MTKCWIELDKQTAFLVTLPFDTSWPWPFDVTLTFNCIINASNRFTGYFIHENEVLYVTLSQIVTKIWIDNSNRRPFWILLNYAKCSTYHKLCQVDFLIDYLSILKQQKNFGVSKMQGGVTIGHMATRLYCLHHDHTSQSLISDITSIVHTLLIHLKRWFLTILLLFKPYSYCFTKIPI